MQVTIGSSPSQGQPFIDDITSGLSWMFPPGLVDYPHYDEIAKLDELIGLAGKRVLEPGCFEGYITVEMARRGADVTAFDPRPMPLCKAFARALTMPLAGSVCLAAGDARDIPTSYGKGEFDILFHAGLLYHLPLPVKHLLFMRGMFQYVLLETHVAPERDQDVTNANLDAAISQNEGFEGRWYRELGWADAPSGLDERSFWLTEASLLRLIAECGLQVVSCITNNDAATHGPRRCYLLERQ